MISTVSRSLYTGTSTDTRAVARSIGVRGRNRDTTAGRRCVTGGRGESSVIVDTGIVIVVESRSANETRSERERPRYASTPYRVSLRYSVDGSIPSASAARDLLPLSLCSTHMM